VCHGHEPIARRFDTELGEFVLPYPAVRTAHDPDAVLLEFLQRTYEAAAETAGWEVQTTAEEGDRAAAVVGRWWIDVWGTFPRECALMARYALNSR
jgi:hypothetical protein